MENNRVEIFVSTNINAKVERVWELWTNPKHIVKWNNASDDWHTPFAENNLRVGGSFSSRMEAKDGSMGFDFRGVYDEVEKYKLISYTLGDERKVKITFEKVENETNIIESFEAEDENAVELQKYGWQCILDNFKKYVENTEESL